MTETERFIQSIYDGVIGIVLDGIEEEYWEEAQKKFRKILNNRYSSWKMNADNYDKLYTQFYERELKHWSRLRPGEKKHRLIEDPALEEIISLSNGAFKYARDRVAGNGTIPIKVCDNGIKRMEELLDQVKDFNKQLALWYLSEGGCDFTFASGETDNTSMRLGPVQMPQRRIPIPVVDINPIVVECSEKRRAYATAKMDEERAAMVSGITKKRNDAIDRANRIIAEQTERRLTAQIVLDSLGYIRFHAKKVQMAIIEDANRLLEEAQASIADAKSTYAKEMSQVDKEVKRKIPIFLKEAEEKFPFPDKAEETGSIARRP